MEKQKFEVGQEVWVRGTLERYEDDVVLVRFTGANGNYGVTAFEPQLLAAPFAGMAGLRELVEKLKNILSMSVDSWHLSGHGIFHKGSSAPLIHDHATHPQTLATIADALNFAVRRLALQEFADELEAALASTAEGAPQAGARCFDAFHDKAAPAAAGAAPHVWKSCEPMPQRPNPSLGMQAGAAEPDALEVAKEIHLALNSEACGFYSDGSTCATCEEEIVPLLTAYAETQVLGERERCAKIASTTSIQAIGEGAIRIRIANALRQSAGGAGRE